MDDGRDRYQGRGPSIAVRTGFAGPDSPEWGPCAGTRSRLMFAPMRRDRREATWKRGFWPSKVGGVLAPLVLASAIVGCGREDLVGPEPGPGTEVGSVPHGFPLELESANGRRSVLTAPARHVLPGNAGALDLLLAVADDDWVAAINVGTRPYSVALADPKRLAQAPELKAFDMESIAVLAPDLVITHAWQTLDKGPFLERMSIPVLELGESDGLESIERDLERIGRALDRSERADEVIADLRRRVAALRTVDRSAYEVLTLSGGDTGTWTAGSGTTAATLVDWANATHVPTELGLEGHFQLDHEGLLEIDPQVIVVSSDDGTLEGSSSWRALRSDERLSGLRALGGDGFGIALESRRMGTTSHQLLEAAEALAAALDSRSREAPDQNALK